MSSNLTSSDRVWPKTGLWAASYRVMFPLAALWAAICVALWQWDANLELSLGWHIHEMTFGFAGAALAGYLLTACPSWTGRAPVSGWPLMVLAALWLTARGTLLVIPVLAPIPAAGFFFWLAALLGSEARKGGKEWRPGFIFFALGAGLGSGLWTFALARGALPPGVAILPIFGFALLLIVVGGQIVPAFLSRAASKRGEPLRVEPLWLAPVSLVTLGTALAGFLAERPEVAGGFLRLAALLIIARMAHWSLKSARRDALLAILTLGYLWLPVGLYLWGASLTGSGPLTGPQSIHALIMGAMGGLILAVSARSVALRTPDGLRPRRCTVLAFALIWLATWVRMFDALDLAAALWCIGWLLYVLLFLPAFKGSVPRPVFSGARNR